MASLMSLFNDTVLHKFQCLFNWFDFWHYEKIMSIYNFKNKYCSWPKVLTRRVSVIYMGVCSIESNLPLTSMQVKNYIQVFSGQFLIP